MSATAPTVRFEDLVAPVAPEEFLDAYWERRHLFLHRGDPDYYGTLFSFADVDRWISLAQAAPADLLLIVPPPDSGRKTERKKLRDVSLGRLYAAFHAGNTLVLEGIQKHWPAVARLADSLREAFTAAVNVNLYMTPAGAQGAPVHPDVQDVFVLQVDGAKDWTLYEQREDLCLETLTYLREIRGNVLPRMEGLPLVGEARLEKGDFLYIPRGLPHKAVSPASGPSLHLTVCITPVSWVDFLKAAVEVASTTRPELARAVRPGFATRPEARRALSESFAGMLRAFAESASCERTLGVLMQSRAQAPKYPADGHFAQLVRLGEVSPDSIAERREGMSCTVSRDNGAAAIRFAASNVSGPAALGPALEHIHDHARFRIGDLPGELDDEDKLVLVRRLIREGLLRVAPGESGG